MFAFVCYSGGYNTFAINKMNQSPEEGGVSFRIPHKPPAGSLRVLHAPARRGGIWRVSKTKINNFGTDEFVSNPPFSKFWLTFWQERWI